MCFSKGCFLLLVAGDLLTQPVFCQSQPDVLIFTDGERLIGHLVGSKGKSVTFKSDMAGEITVDWSKVQELHSGNQFAVIPKDVQLRGAQDAAKAPQGAIEMTNQRLIVTPAGQPPQTIPVPDAADVVPEASFQNALHHISFLKAWQGALAGGVSLIRATQNVTSYTTSISLVRAVPTESWVDPRDRTIIDFTATAGKLTQPNTPEVKTSIYHADGERDEYFSARFYAFGQVAYDHNFSQGLDLQQTYGGGIGFTVVKTSNSTLDVKGNFDYIRQAFEVASQNQNLAAGSVAERYNRTLAHGIVVNEQLMFTPAFNNSRAYSGFGSASVTVPVYKRFNLTSNLTDTFLNDPPPGFKKNSVQFTTSVSYTLPK